MHAARRAHKYVHVYLVIHLYRYSSLYLSVCPSIHPSFFLFVSVSLFPSHLSILTNANDDGYRNHQRLIIIIIIITPNTLHLYLCAYHQGHNVSAGDDKVISYVSLAMHSHDHSHNTVADTDRSSQCPACDTTHLSSWGAPFSLGFSSSFSLPATQTCTQTHTHTHKHTHTQAHKTHTF